MADHLLDQIARDVHAGISTCGRTMPRADGLHQQMPLRYVTRDLIQQMIGHGMTDKDFSTLLLMQAKGFGHRAQA